MYNIVPSGGYLWTISPRDGNNRFVIIVMNTSSYEGSMPGLAASVSAAGISPTLYLTSSITLTGDGTEGNPYVITN